jgi:hypothetical protein
MCSQAQMLLHILLPLQLIPAGLVEPFTAGVEAGGVRCSAVYLLCNCFNVKSNTHAAVCYACLSCFLQAL